MRSGARIADGLEVIGSEPDHDFRFVRVPARIAGDESVVGDVRAGGGSIIAVESCQNQALYQISLSDTKLRQRVDQRQNLLTPSSMRIECYCTSLEVGNSSCSTRHLGNS